MPAVDIHQIDRMPNGVATSNTGMAYHLPRPDPTKLYEYFNDFFTYAAGDWTVTETDAGATEALADGAGGHLLITNTAAENDLVSLQQVKESFLLVAGKRTFFKIRFKVSDATQLDLFLGLMTTDTSPIVSAANDRFGFQKDDGDANVDFVSMKDGAGTTETAVTTLTADTFAVLEIYFDGANAWLFKDGTLVKKSNAITICDNEEMALTIAIQAGEAVAKTMTIDYVYVAQER